MEKHGVIYLSIHIYINTNIYQNNHNQINNIEPGVKTFEQNGDVYIFLILPKYHFSFSFSTALQKLQMIVTCFPEDRISSMYPDLQIFKFSPFTLLMHGFSFWSISECLNLL